MCICRLSLNLHTISCHETKRQLDYESHSVLVSKRKFDFALNNGKLLNKNTSRETFISLIFVILFTLAILRYVCLNMHMFFWTCIKYVLTFLILNHFLSNYRAMLLLESLMLLQIYIIVHWSSSSVVAGTLQRAACSILLAITKGNPKLYFNYFNSRSRWILIVRALVLSR